MSTWLWSPMLIWGRQILDIHIGRGLIYGDDLSSCEISKGWARRSQTCTAEHKPKVTMHQRTQYILDDASRVLTFYSSRDLASSTGQDSLKIKICSSKYIRPKDYTEHISSRIQTRRRIAKAQAFFMLTLKPATKPRNMVQFREFREKPMSRHPGRHRATHTSR